jgi:hypothetical protein
LTVIGAGIDFFVEFLSNSNGEILEIWDSKQYEGGIWSLIALLVDCTNPGRSIFGVESSFFFGMGEDKKGVVFVRSGSSFLYWILGSVLNKVKGGFFGVQNPVFFADSEEKRISFWFLFSKKSFCI